MTFPFTCARVIPHPISTPITFGRTDLPTAKPSKIHISIREKLFILPEDTLVLTGHGEETTIGEEKQHNPYVC